MMVELTFFFILSSKNLKQHYMTSQKMLIKIKVRQV